MSDKTWLKEG